MDTTATPPRIAALIARNLMPVAGVLFLGWSASNMMILYYADTVLELAVVVLLVARHVTGLGRPGERTRELNGPLDWVRAGIGSLFGATLIGLPLGVPLFIMLATLGWTWTDLADRGFLTALAVQIAGSLAAAFQVHRDLLERSDDERVLKHRAAFIVARWAVVIVAAIMVPIGILGPWLGGALLVLVYAGGTAYFELFPGRALQWLNPKEARKDEVQDGAVRRARGGR